MFFDKKNSTGFHFPHFSNEESEVQDSKDITKNFYLGPFEEDIICYSMQILMNEAQHRNNSMRDKSVEATGKNTQC